MSVVQKGLFNFLSVFTFFSAYSVSKWNTGQPKYERNPPLQCDIPSFYEGEQNREVSLHSQLEN